VLSRPVKPAPQAPRAPVRTFRGFNVSNSGSAGSEGALAEYAVWAGGAALSRHELDRLKTARYAVQQEFTDLSGRAFVATADSGFVFGPAVRRVLGRATAGVVPGFGYGQAVYDEWGNHHSVPGKLARIAMYGTAHTAVGYATDAGFGVCTSLDEAGVGLGCTAAWSGLMYETDKKVNGVMDSVSDWLGLG
jgi:hypothetical protein